MPKLDFLSQLFFFFTGTVEVLIFSYLLVYTQRWHGKLTHDYTEGIQKFHDTAVPRVGGIALWLGLVFTLWALEKNELSALLYGLIIASLPAFVAGLLEDTTRRVGVLARFIATMSSGILAYYLLGAYLPRVDVPGIDILLMYIPLAVLFTSFAVAGVANAVNIIDGFNGLSSGLGFISFLAMSLISLQLGDTELFTLGLIVAFLVLGFLLINFPYGKMFLGDGGAYLLGFMQSYLAILLVMRHSDVSAWAILLTCSYPINETVFSIFRRIKHGRHPGHPDRLHLHSLIYRRVVLLLPNLSSKKETKNATVSLYCWGISAVPAIISMWTFNNHGLSVGIYLLSLIAYILIYRRLLLFSWSRVWGRA